MRKAFAFAILLLLSTFAFANGQSSRVVRPKDSVSVTCEQEHSIDKQYVITPDGFIVMPLAGAVQIGGLTEEAAAAKIQDSLVREKILSSASVHLKIVSSLSGVVSFSGEVAKSGEIPPRDGLRLSDVVQAAEPSPRANLHRVRVVTGAGNEFLVDYAAFDGHNMASNPSLRAGDHIFFDSNGGTAVVPVPAPAPAPSKQSVPAPAPVHPQPQVVTPQPAPQEIKQGTAAFVTVTGAVATPKVVAWSPGLTVSGAIDGAGGLTKDADSDGVTISRKIDGQMRTLKESVKDVQNGMAGDIALRPNDVIQVPTHRKSHGINRTLKIGAAVLLGLVLLHP